MLPLKLSWKILCKTLHLTVFLCFKYLSKMGNIFECGANIVVCTATWPKSELLSKELWMLICSSLTSLSQVREKDLSDNLSDVYVRRPFNIFQFVRNIPFDHVNEMMIFSSYPLPARLSLPQSQLTLTCSRSTVEILWEGVKYVQN